MKMNELIDIKLIFESVHKKHQFAELMNFHDKAHCKDLKMLNMTWNMGGANQSVFKDQPESILKDIGSFDVVAICV